MSPSWIKESQAAEKLNIQPRTLRAKVKKGELKIHYSTISGKNFFYNEHDITKVITAHSNMPKKLIS